VSEPRLNRAGIPILDPPKQTNRLPKQCPSPGDHRWGPPVEIDRVWDAAFDEVSVRCVSACRWCGVKDTYWRVIR
jgi:hypothetical protein